MDIKKICRICFQMDIDNKFIDIIAVPGLVQEMSTMYGIEVSKCR